MPIEVEDWSAYRWHSLAHLERRELVVRMAERYLSKTEVNLESLVEQHR